MALPKCIFKKLQGTKVPTIDRLVNQELTLENIRNTNLGTEDEWTLLNRKTILPIPNQIAVRFMKYQGNRYDKLVKWIKHSLKTIRRDDRRAKIKIEDNKDFRAAAIMLQFLWLTMRSTRSVPMLTEPLKSARKSEVTQTSAGIMRRLFSAHGPTTAFKTTTVNYTDFAKGKPSWHSSTKSYSPTLQTTKMKISPPT